MRKALLAGALAFTIAAPAFAAPVITFTQGSYTTPGSGTVFQNFEAAPGGGAAYTAGAGETVVGDVRVFSATVPGFAVDPDNNPNNKYLSIENGSYSVSFSSAPVNVFSFILGSLDSYNNLFLTLSDGSTFSYSGQQVVGAAAVGPLNSGTAGRVTYNFGAGPKLVSARFSSTQAAFEIDDLAGAVPEPATWAMMIGGFGLVGTQLRSRRRKVQAATA